MWVHSIALRFFITMNKQLQTAKNIKNAIAYKFDNPIVTELTPFTVFYKAELEHHDYYNLNPSQPYCQFGHFTKGEKIINITFKIAKRKIMTFESIDTYDISITNAIKSHYKDIIIILVKIKIERGCSTRQNVPPKPCSFDARI